MKIDDVELYVLDVSFLSDYNTFQKMMRYVGSDRIEKLEKIKLEAERERSLGAGLLLSFAMRKHAVDMTDGTFKVEIGVDGKPYLGKSYLNKMPCISCSTDLDGNPRDRLQFNLSHSGKYAVCAVADKDIGVDVQIRETKLSEAFISRCFSKKERSSGIDLMELWSLKESFLKAKGCGLTVSPSRIEVMEQIKTEIIDETTGETIDETIDETKNNKMDDTEKGYEHTVGVKEKRFRLMLDGDDSGYVGIDCGDSIPGYALCMCAGAEKFDVKLFIVTPAMICE